MADGHFSFSHNNKITDDISVELNEKRKRERKKTNGGTFL